MFFRRNFMFHELYALSTSVSSFLKHDSSRAYSRDFSKRKSNFASWLLEACVTNIRLP